MEDTIRNCPDCGKYHKRKTIRCEKCHLKLHPRKNPQVYYSCSKCGDNFDPPKRRALCSTCDYQYNGKKRLIKYKENQRLKKEELLDEFYKNGCSICDIKNRVVLQAHHKVPHLKTFSIGNAFQNSSISAFKAELAKCAPLCANCHLLVHAGQAVVE